MSLNDTEKIYISLGQWLNSVHSISEGGKENIRLSGSPTTRKQFQSFFASSKEAVESALKGEDIQRYKNLKMDLIDALQCTPSKAEAEIASRLFNKIKHYLDEKRRKEVGIDKSALLTGSIPFQDYTAVRDALSPHTYMLNKKTGRIKRDFDYEQWKRQLRESSLDAKSKAEIMGEQILGVVVYNPFDTRDQYKDEWDGTPKVLHANAHITPDWRRKSIEDPKLPEQFKELLNHLFLEDKKSIEYALFWLYTMLTSRNQTYLHLIGGKGVGKGSFFRIAAQLIGVDNYVNIDLSFWDNKFNSEIRDRRLCYFDEHDIKDTNLSQLKLYANDEIPIHEKNVNTRGNYKNYASMAISNNPKDAINRIEYQDRRFSIPLCRQDGDISEVLGREWEETLRYKTEKDWDFIAQIGHWILKHGDEGKFDPEFSSGKAFKSELFYETVEKNLLVWQQEVIKQIVEGGKEITLDKIRDVVAKQGINRLSTKKVVEFLKYHMDRDGDKYGYVKFKDKFDILIPFAKYKKGTEEDKKDTGDVDYSKMGF